MTRRRPLAGAAGLALALALAALPRAAAPAPDADGVVVRSSRVFASRGILGIEVSLGGFWSPRVRGTLERGMPATLLVTADLWQHRSGWFDRLVTTRSLVYRLRYDAWREDYDLRRGTEPSRHLDSLGAVRAVLEQPLRLPLAATRTLAPEHRYYLVITASLRPLSPEGVEEVERFLSSQLRGGQGGPGAATVVRLPSSLLSVLAALSGLGDEIAVHRTRPFTVDARELVPAP